MTNGHSLALMCFLVSTIAAASLPAAETAGSRQTNEVNYLEPRVVTGTIYEKTDLKKILFTFRRTATNSGPDVCVAREYFLPGGKLAAREDIVYTAGKFRSYHFDDLQNGTVATAVIKPDRGGEKIVFDFKQFGGHETDSEKFESTMLVNDMVVPYLLQHWDELMKGQTVRCRIITVSRTETIGFKFTKESETARFGKPVVIVRMEPSSVIIAQFVETLYFTIEKAEPHRVFQYYGRTAPAIRKNGKWEDLDALTVFDWK